MITCDKEGQNLFLIEVVSCRQFFCQVCFDLHRTERYYQQTVLRSLVNVIHYTLPQAVIRCVLMTYTVFGGTLNLAQSQVRCVLLEKLHHHCSDTFVVVLLLTYSEIHTKSLCVDCTAQYIRAALLLQT